MEMACPLAPAKEARSVAALTVRIGSFPIRWMDDVAVRFFMVGFRRLLLRWKAGVVSIIAGG